MWHVRNLISKSRLLHRIPVYYINVYYTWERLKTMKLSFVFYKVTFLKYYRTVSWSMKQRKLDRVRSKKKKLARHQKSFRKQLLWLEKNKENSSKADTDNPIWWPNISVHFHIIDSIVSYIYVSISRPICIWWIHNTGREHTTRFIVHERIKSVEAIGV